MKQSQGEELQGYMGRPRRLGRILTLPTDREPSSARSGPERNGARKQIQRYLRS